MVLFNIIVNQKQMICLMQLFCKYAEPSIEYILHGNKNGKSQDKLLPVIPVQDMELCKTAV
jgi:hypothetical protein